MATTIAATTASFITLDDFDAICCLCLRRSDQMASVFGDGPDESILGGDGDGAKPHDVEPQNWIGLLVQLTGMQV